MALVAPAGCGDDPATDPRDGLLPAPDGVTAGCREAAESTPSLEVLCPGHWPAASRPGRVHLRLYDDRREAYLLEEQEGFRARTRVFHVLFGGQRRPFPPGFEGGGGELRVTTRLETTPIAGGGRFVVSRPTRRVGSTRIHGRPAAVMRAPAYPRGGIHGDHAIVMWNEGGHGYLVSAHSERSFRTATEVAQAIARSTALLPDD